MTNAMFVLLAAAALCANDDPADPRGSIAFMRGGRVSIIPAGGGEARPLTEELPYKADRPLVWMPDGRRLLYWKHGDIGWDIWACDPEVNEHTNLTHAAAGGCRSAAPSPDGKQIAFLRDDPPGLYLMNADGSSPRRLTVRGHRDAPPSWSRDGRALAFEDESGALHLIDADGGNERRVAHGFGPDWSQAADHLVFARDGELWMATQMADRLKNMTNTPNEAEDAPRWSPRGDRLAYWSRAGQQSWLKMSAADGSRTVSVAAVSEPSFRSTTWSPDGRWLAFSVGPRGSERLEVIRTDGTGRRQLAQDGAVQPAWRPVVCEREASAP